MPRRLSAVDGNSFVSSSPPTLIDWLNSSSPISSIVVVNGIITIYFIGCPYGVIARSLGCIWGHWNSPGEVPQPLKSDLNNSSINFWWHRKNSKNRLNPATQSCNSAKYNSPGTTHSSILGEREEHKSASPWLPVLLFMSANFRCKLAASGTSDCLSWSISWVLDGRWAVTCEQIIISSSSSFICFGNPLRASRRWRWFTPQQ